MLFELGLLFSDLFVPRSTSQAEAFAEELEKHDGE